MPAYRLHCFAQSGNSYKVALTLELAQADWAPVFVDFFGGETRSPAFREAVNAMGEVPVLEHDGRRLAQSGVILTALAERFPQFAPRGEDEHLEAMRWLFFDNHKFTSYLATYRFLKNFAAPGAVDPAIVPFLEGRWKAAAAIVEKHLASRAFMLGARPTIVDFSLAGYVFYPQSEHGIDFPAQYPAIHAWKQRIAALPRWKGPYDLMPGKAG